MTHALYEHLAAAPGEKKDSSKAEDKKDDNYGEKESAGTLVETADNWKESLNLPERDGRFQTEV